MLVGAAVFAAEYSKTKLVIVGEMLFADSKEEDFARVLIIYNLIGAAICEEYFFRYYLIGDRYFNWIYMLISAIMFLLYHASLPWGDKYRFVDYAIKLPFDEMISPTYVGALYRQLRLVLQKRPSGILHCCGGEAISRYDFGLRIAGFLGLDASNIMSISGESYRPKNVSLNVSCSERLLGIKYPTVDEMLREMTENEADNG